MQHRRVAAAVQEDERLLLRSSRWPMASSNCGDRPCFICRRRVSTSLIAGRLLARARRQRQPQVAAALGVLPVSSEGVAEPSTTGTFRSCARHTAVARRIAQAVLLLVGRVVFFIDDDQAQLGQRREYRHARAQQHARGRWARDHASSRSPSDRPLCITAAVRPQLRLQPRPQRAFELRRQIDFRDHQQHLTTGGQHALGGAQVDLGLAAAGHAVQQHGLEAIQGGQRFHRRLLRIVQRRRLVGLSRRARLLALATVQPRHRPAGGALALIGGRLA